MKMVEVKLLQAFSDNRYPGEKYELPEDEAKRYVENGAAKYVNEEDALRLTDGGDTETSEVGKTSQDKQSFEGYCPLTVKNNKVDDFTTFAAEKEIDLGEAKTKQEMYDAIHKYWEAQQSA